MLLYVPCSNVLKATVTEFRLHRNLQRIIFKFKTEASLKNGDVRAAHFWNLFRNQPQTQKWTSPELEEQCWLEWLFELRHGKSLGWVERQLGGLERFFCFLVCQGVLGKNLLTPFIQRHRSRRALTRTLWNLSDCGLTSARKALREVETRPPFESHLAGCFKTYLEHLETRRGRPVKHTGPYTSLRVLDRVLQHHKVDTPRKISAPVLEDDLEADSTGAPRTPSAATQSRRLTTLRSLCRFLQRRGVETPFQLIQRWPLPRDDSFRPHIYTLKELAQILEAFNRQGDTASRPITWRGLELIVYLLYACGLRVSEALRLRLDEVDLDARVMLIRCTKFYKDRWVPFGQAAAQRLVAYQVIRNQAFPGRQDLGEPLFLSSRGCRIDSSTVNGRFRHVVDTLVGIRSRGTRPPRPHDLRHTAAVHRLYKWYAEGADVQNKLPLLSTYLGHSRYSHTEAYLHLTEDLLRQAGRNFQNSFEKIVGKVLGHAQLP